MKDSAAHDINRACGGTARWLRWRLRSLLIGSRESGKAVRTGHSSAAVSHHEPSSRHGGNKASLRPSRGRRRGARTRRGAQIPDSQTANPNESAAFPAAAILGDRTSGVWSLCAERAPNAESEDLPLEAHCAGSAAMAEGRRETFIAYVKGESGSRDDCRSGFIPRWFGA